MEEEVIQEGVLCECEDTVGRCHPHGRSRYFTYLYTTRTIIIITITMASVNTYKYDCDMEEALFSFSV